MKEATNTEMNVAEKESPPICVKCLSGASLVQFKPLFSYDSRFLLVIAVNEIKVFGTKSGTCVRTLIGHETRVISLQTNPSNHLQVLSCSVDGVVIKWNYEDGTMLSSVHLNDIEGVRCFFAPSKKWYVVPEKQKYGAYCLLEVLPKEKGETAFQLATILEDVIPTHNAIAFGMEGNLVCSANKKDLRVSYSPDKIFRRHTTWSTITCVTCHPRDCVVATGDVKGRIYVWRNILGSRYPAHALYHWHSLPVGDLAFTQEGSFLYSGGGECVLVKWRLDSTKDPQFIPRMGLPLCHITTSPDNSYVATSHTDNAIQLVSPQHFVVGVVQGLTQSSNTFPVGLLYDPRSQSLVLNGRPGHLQFYHPHQDKQLYNLDIVGQNYVTGPENFKVHNLEVEKAAINWDGTWLATVEHRDDGETSVEIRLKFWRFDKTEQEFCLNTNILLPHNKRINVVKFKPPSEESSDDDVSMLITTSADQKFKFWILRRTENQAKGVVQECWMCHSLGYYHCHPAEGADFSEDGSLAAVAFGHALTLWTTEVTAMKSALVSQHDGTFIRNVAFGRGACCHLVVSQTPTSLTVWNVLSLTVSWNVQTRIAHLAVDPMSDVMAAFTVDKNNMFVFRPSDPAPIFIYPSVVSGAKILAAAFIPASSSRDGQASSSRLPWSSGCTLVFITSKRDLLTITSESEEKQPENVGLTQNVSKTPFGLMMAKYQKNAAPEEETTRHLTRGLLGIKALNDILDVPSHVLPPVSSICGSFLSSLLVNEEKHETDEKHDEKIKKTNPMEEKDVEYQNADDLVLDLHSLRLESYDWLNECLHSRETYDVRSNVSFQKT